MFLLNIKTQCQNTYLLRNVNKCFLFQTAYATSPTTTPKQEKQTFEENTHFWTSFELKNKTYLFVSIV